MWAGPLALVRDGDLIQIDVEARRIDLLLSEAVLAERRAAWARRHLPASTGARGTLYLQAHPAGGPRLRF